MSDHKFRDIFSDVHHYSSVGAMLLNADGTALFINPVGRELFGCENRPPGFTFFDSAIFSPDEISSLKCGEQINREVLLDFDALRQAGLETEKLGYQWLLCDIVPVGPAALSDEYPELYAAHFFDVSSQQLLKQKLASLWSSANAAFWEYNPFNDSYTISDEFRQMLGIPDSVESLNSEQMFEFLHEDDRDQTLETVKSGIENKITEQNMEAKLIHSDGHIIEVLVFSANVFDSQGRLITRYGITQDITRRRNIARKLLDSEKRYHDLFNSMENAFALHEMIYDEQGQPVDYVFIEVNPAFSKHTGWLPQQVVGKRMREVAPGTEDYWFQIYGKVASTGEPVEFENYASDRNKYYHVYAFCPEKGQFAVIFSDITERKAIEQKLIKSEHMFRNLFSNIPDSTFLVDLEKFRFLHVNPAAVKQYGYTEQEFYGLTPAEISLGSDRLFNALQQRKQTYIPRTTHRRADGSHFDAEVNITWFELEGKPMAVATVHDLIRQDRLAAQLIQAQKMDALGRLAGGVAHDFNNLLQVIIGFGQMIQSSGESPQCSSLAGEILQAGRRAKTLTDRMLAFSRKDFEVDMTSIDLARLLEDFRPVISRAISENIEIEWNCPAPQSLPRIHGDATQIEQVIMNLCINAADAMPDGGKLTLTVVCEGKDFRLENSPESTARYVRLSVKDNGLGMSRQVADRIFEPFFTTKRAGGGTGLGLASSYAIIERHGGLISVDSQPGKGSTFNVWLAVDENDIVEQESPPVAAVESNFSECPAKGLKILLVEDDPMVRRFVVKALTKEGAEITEACDGREVEAIANNSNERFDLIIMDVIMPGESGVKVADKLRLRGWDTPILFASGYSPERIGDIPGGAIINKPFGVQELLEAISNILNTGAKA